MECEARQAPPRWSVPARVGLFVVFFAGAVYNLRVTLRSPASQLEQLIIERCINNAIMVQETSSCAKAER
jgi:hypothetical protein